MDQRVSLYPYVKFQFSTTIPNMFLKVHQFMTKFKSKENIYSIKIKPSNSILNKIYHIITYHPWTGKMIAFHYSHNYVWKCSQKSN